MKSSNNLTLTTSPRSQPAKKPRITANLTLRQRLLYGGKRRYYTGKERDSETGLYYYGARYLDSKTSRWISGDPAMGEYVPEAPINDEARKRNGSLPGMGGVFNYVNLHVYHYAGNNPVKYVDPDGRLQVDSKSNFIFWAELNQDGSMKTERVKRNSGIFIDVTYGYLKTNDGTLIKARYNTSDNVRAENFDCHGYTFTDGTFWIDNDQIDTLLNGDGYTKTMTPQAGDVMIQRDKDGNVTHSAIITGVDLKKGEIRVKEAMGTVEFETPDGRKTRVQDNTYKTDGSHGNIEFYQRPPNRVIE